MWCKLHFGSSNVKHANDVFQEYVSQNKEVTWGAATSAIGDTRRACVITVGKNHVQWIDSESYSTNSDGMCGGYSIAFDSVCTLISIVSGRGRKGGVDSIGNVSGIVVQCCTGVNLGFFEVSYSYLQVRNDR